MGNIRKINFKTEKGEFLLLEIPDGTKLVLIGSEGIHYCIKLSGEERCIKVVNYKEFRLTANIAQLTEEQASQLFERDDIFKMYQYYIDTVPYMFTTGLETLHSLLEANGIVFEYDMYNDCKNEFCQGGRIDVGYGESMTCSYCEEMEETIWDINRTYIFKQLK